MRSRFWCHHTTTISCCRGFSAAIFWLCTFGCASTQCCAIQKDYSAGNSQLSLLQHYYRMYLWETKPHVFFGAVEVGKSLPSHSRRSSCCSMPRIVAQRVCQLVQWYALPMQQRDWSTWPYVAWSGSSRDSDCRALKRSWMFRNEELSSFFFSSPKNLRTKSRDSM